VDDKSDLIRFAVVDGVVVKMAKDIEDDEQLHVLVIDEMNRANLPRVLGELMYLFEYRDQDETIDLQYSTNFSLPSNLKFIGTMNTADRSIRSIDSALRHRFEIFECLPERPILERFYARGLGVNTVASLFDGFDELNAKLRDALDRHHTIGHTFFMAKEMSPAHLRKVWKYKLGPLIEEYFFGQEEDAKSFTPQLFWPGLSSA
jgi:5-methylcytosine-specific restriction endonuclease McrBC GTP-binding regulatory subunit McrB